MKLGQQQRVYSFCRGMLKRKKEEKQNPEKKGKEFQEIFAKK